MTEDSRMTDDLFPRYTPEEAQQRLEAATAETLRRKAQQRDERTRKTVRRDAGLQKRHAQKLARNTASAVIDPSGTRCRYLVSEEPPLPCPNERVPGAELCRPHLTHAVQLARRLGLTAEGAQP